MTIINKLGGRKFIYVMSCLLISTGLLVNGELDKEVFKAIVIYTSGLYLAANVVQKIKVPESIDSP